MAALPVSGARVGQGQHLEFISAGVCIVIDAWPRSQEAKRDGGTAASAKATTRNAPYGR